MKHSAFSLLLSVTWIIACDGVPVDDEVVDGGTAPEPTGVLQGTILYAGPRPLCEDIDGDGNFDRPLGRVVLTLFAYDNPPPPTGAATTSLNLLTVPGESLFTGLGDCMPVDPTPADRAFIQRAVEFVWPEQPLGASYQIRGFYDYDGNFNPFFSVTNLPTAGDVVGGAFLDPAAPIRVFRPLTFGTREEQPRGQVLNGISVTLGGPVVTERPVFYLESAPLPSNALLPMTADPVQSETQLFALTQSTLRHYVPATEDFDALVAALTEAGLAPTLDGEPNPLRLELTNPLAYAWYVRPVDANNDGAGDLHPLLGGLGVPWLTPVVVMQRARSPLEVVAGVPNVRLIPTVSVVDATARGISVHAPDIAIGVPPIAAVSLNPADARCTIPIIPGGNLAPVYEAVTADCQELPTGFYGISVLHGVAAAVPAGGALRACGEPGFLPLDSIDAGGDGCYLTSPDVEICGDADRCVVPPPLSATGFDLIGGSYSGQAWTIPNELGDPAQLPETLDPAAHPDIYARLVRQQGVGGTFSVHDTAADPEVRLECEQGVDPTTGTARPIRFARFTEPARGLDEAEAASLVETCCAPVRHLCGVPLCSFPPAGTESAHRNVRSGPATVDDNGIPDCVPFEMPSLCCPSAD